MVTLLFTRGSTTKFLPVCSETQPITASSSASLKLSVTDCAAADTRAPTLNHANNAAISQLFRPLLSFLFLLLSLSINAASPCRPRRHACECYRPHPLFAKLTAYLVECFFFIVPSGLSLSVALCCASVRRCSCWWFCCCAS